MATEEGEHEEDLERHWERKRDVMEGEEQGGRGKRRRQVPRGGARGGRSGSGGRPLPRGAREDIAEGDVDAAKVSSELDAALDPKDSKRKASGRKGG